MTSELSLDEVVHSVVAELPPTVAARCDVFTLLTTLEQHGIASYEDLGDSLTGKAAPPLRAALLTSAPLAFLSVLVALYYKNYRGVPRGLPDEELAKANEEWWEAHDNTTAVLAAAHVQQQLERPRILRSAVRARDSPVKPARQIPALPSTVQAKRRRR